MNFLLNRPHWGKGIVKALENSERIKVVNNDEEIPNADFVFRWGCTSTVPGDPVVVNSAKAIHYIYDKKASRLMLSIEGLSPQSWGSMLNFCESVNPNYVLDPPILVRKSPHFRSQDMSVCYNLMGLAQVCGKYETKNEDYYLSVFHDKHREFRVFVCSGRVLAVIEKHPSSTTSISWGCVETGIFEYIPWTSWPVPVLDVAVRATEACRLDFGAIDVIVDTEGSSLVLELNSAPDVTPYYGKCFIKAWEYIIDHGKDFIPVTDEQKTWKSYIHPAMGA